MGRLLNDDFKKARCLNDDFYLESREAFWSFEEKRKGGIGDEELPGYQYNQLAKGQIRLLEILPDHVRGYLIYCRIHHPFLSDKPRYEALSYCWGSSTKQRYIIAELDGGWIQKIEVTDNLYSALWRLRDLFEPWWMWVDAVCIYSHRS